jgi:hypothetical protein
MGGLKAQGYVYGKPETAEQVRQRLRLAGLLAAPGRPLRSREEASPPSLDDRPKRIFYP